MKKLLIIFGVLSFSSFAHAQFENLRSGERILEQSKNAYLNLKRYEGSCASISHYEPRDQKAPHQDLATAQAQIDYTHGGLLKIHGRETSGTPFWVWSDGKTSKLNVIRGGKSETKVERDLEMAIAGASGISAGAASTIPSVLTGLNWGNPLLNKGQATFKRIEMLGEHECYVVENRLPKRQNLQTFWIDSKTYLIRQLREDIAPITWTEQELAGLSDAQRQRILKVEPAYMSITEVFSIKNAEFKAGKTPVNLFELPADFEKQVAKEEEPRNMVAGPPIKD